MLAGYQRKLTKEAVIKSGVFGLIAGFLLMILISVISFATKYNAMWISLSVWAAASVGCTLLLYFTVFKTTAEKTASRMDEMGLDERVITMLELQGTDSVIAQKQRADTQSVLQNVTPQKMKFGGLKLFIVFASILGAIAVAAILMMSFSTVQAVRAASTDPTTTVQTPISEEDKIIQEMLEELRKEIADAKIKESLRDRLNGMVDDLEKSLRPTDSLEVKIAKISDTAQKIHKLLQEAMQATTIPEELQTHDTTEKLGDALVSGDFKRVESAFDDMYDSIKVLAASQKYVLMQQTAYDILDSIEDADEKDEELAEVLKGLAQAFLDAIPEFPPPPPGEGEEEVGGDELDQAAQEAIEDAKDAIQGIMSSITDKEEIDKTDQNLNDIFQEALGNLGQEPSTPEQPDDGDKDKDKDSAGPAHPSDNGDILYDSVIDGKTPYDTVYDEYYEKALGALASGNLTDEQRDIIEKYLELLELLK